MTLLANLVQRLARFWCELAQHDADVVSWHDGTVHVPVHMRCLMVAVILAGNL